MCCKSRVTAGPTVEDWTLADGYGSDEVDRLWHLWQQDCPALADALAAANEARTERPGRQLTPVEPHLSDAELLAQVSSYTRRETEALLPSRRDPAQADVYRAAGDSDNPFAWAIATRFRAERPA